MQAPFFIKNYYQNRLIKKVPISGSVKKQVVNLDKAMHVGVVYYLEDDNTHRDVSSFVKRLQDKKKRVYAFAFVKNKYLTRQYLPKLSYDYFYEKDLNWYGKPHGQYVEDFIKKEFDILIDLSDGNIFPIRYLISRATAKTKIGLFNEKNKEILDLFIKTDNISDVKQLINQIEYYLSIINKK